MVAPLLLALLLTPVAWPPSAHGHETGGALDVTPTTVPAGGRLRVAGGEAAPGERVSLLVFGARAQRPVGTTAADDHGDFAADLVLPRDLEPGTYDVRAFGRDRALGEASVAVTEAPPDPVMIVAVLGAAGLAALVLLAVLLLQRRRRKVAAAVATRAAQRTRKTAGTRRR